MESKYRLGLSSLALTTATVSWLVYLHVPSNIESSSRMQTPDWSLPTEVLPHYTTPPLPLMSAKICLKTLVLGYHSAK